MNYTLNQLKIFLKIVETGSITKAAEELHLTQPAVSIQLKNFQDQFKIPLTEVVGRKLFITDFGKEIATAVENILTEIANIDYKTLSHTGHLFGKIKFSVVSTGKYVMPYFLTDFIKKNTGVELLLDVTNKAKVLESLEKNETDFALVSVLPTKLQFEKVALLQNKLFLVSNNSFEFNKKNYDRKIFEQVPLIYRESGSGTRYVMEQFIEKNKLPVKKKMELTTNEAVKQAVIAGLGCSIMPLIGIKNELQNESLRIIPVKGFPIKSTWYLIWLKGKKFSTAASLYLDYIKKEKEKIVTDKFKWFEEF
ncbi:MAG: LysR family transcriptional regulator [Chitinophagaceae bacterium]